MTSETVWRLPRPGLERVGAGRAQKEDAVAKPEPLMPSLAPVLGLVVAVDGERTPRGVTPLPNCMKIARPMQAPHEPLFAPRVSARPPPPLTSSVAWGRVAGYPEHER
jgi:hypothetical protein